MDDLKFVNRGAELAYLEQCLRHAASAPAFVIVRSPPGFGKSRLTDQLRNRLPGAATQVCIVDPAIRGRTGSVRVHDGFFIQRCADELTRMADAGSSRWLSLRTFIKARRWKTALEKRHTEAASDLPSLGHAYRVAFDYTARIFGFGRYSAHQLLISDHSDAVRICVEYVEHALAKHRVVLVVREVQHIDLESLRILLDLNGRGAALDLIFEYTSETGEFEPEHQKLLIRAADTRVEMSILDLIPLEPAHLESLIRQYVKSDYELTSDFYLTWSGNLRSIIELRFRVGIGRRITSSGEIVGLLSNLSKVLDGHLRELSALQQLALVTVYANAEPVDRRVLVAVVNAVHPHMAITLVDAALAELVGIHGFLSAKDKSYSLRDETIATAISEATFLRPVVALAERELRDFYRAVINEGRYTDVSLAASVRLLFRLCARTKDVAGLLRAADTLTVEVKKSQDQSVYIEIVAAAIEAQPELFTQDYDELLTWAASLAYGISDWGRCSELLQMRTTQDSFSLAMRACALQEIGRHDEALQIAAAIRDRASTPAELFVAKLIEGLINGCRGDEDGARKSFSELTGDKTFATSPLVGYAYRFFEIVDGFVECVDKLTASVAWFERFDFHRSKAYSQLPAAMFLARMGEIPRAQRMVADAQQILTNEVRDQHLILNNSAAVELLSVSPRYPECISQLIKALRSSRDDYSELTIVTNLAIAHWGAGDMSPALDCVERMLKILERHDFADQDVYWPVCFNAAQILTEAGMIERSEAVLRFPRERGRPLSVNRLYWLFRYGESSELPDAYRFLASRPYHPLYLSHWTIDLEGLNLLKRAK